jgi:hypothetical protein
MGIAGEFDKECFAAMQVYQEILEINLVTYNFIPTLF